MRTIVLRHLSAYISANTVSHADAQHHDLLGAFNFVKDKSGRELGYGFLWGTVTSFLVMTGLIIYSFSGQRGPELAPLPFTCTITPRDAKRANLIVFEYQC